MKVDELRRIIKDQDGEVEISIEAKEKLFPAICYSDDPEVVEEPFLIFWSPILEQKLEEKNEELNKWMHRAMAAEEGYRLFRDGYLKIENGLKEIRNNLRCIDGPNEADEYINDALNIAINLLKESGADE